MSDKSTSEQLNKLFIKYPHKNLPVKGPRNYMKMGRQSSVVYSYIDCYQVNGEIEHLLITMDQNLNGNCLVYKNQLTFQYTSRLNPSGLDAIKINFIQNQTRDQLAIVNFCYSYRNGKQINKYAVLGFDFSSITNQEQLILEELSINKKILQVRWHPTEQNMIVTLTEDSFDILRYNQEIDKVQSIRQRDIESKDKTAKLKQIQSGLKIVDFAFWQQSNKAKTETIIAALQDGTLILFEFCLRLQEQEQIITYELLVTQILRRSAQIAIKNIQVYSPVQGTLLLFKKSIADNKKGQYSLIYISCIIKQKNNYFQQPIQCIQCDPDVEGQLQIPYNKLYHGHFYFWHNNRLIRINFEPYVIYLKLLLKNPTKSRIIPNKLKTDIVVEVKLNQMKFLAVDASAVRVLRKNQNSQTYLFSTLAVQSSDLLAEQQSTVQKLKKIFVDLQSKMAEIVRPESQSVTSNLSKNLKSTLTFLKQNTDQKELDGVTQKFQAYTSQVQKQLVSEQKQLNQLFKQVENLSNEFKKNKSKWIQLDQLLSRIERNSKTINDLEIEQQNSSSGTRTVEFLSKNCETLQTRRMDLNPDLRKQYMQSFIELENAIWQIHQAVEQNQILLQNLGFSDSRSKTSRIY